jgi:hypothetical protein
VLEHGHVHGQDREGGLGHHHEEPPGLHLGGQAQEGAGGQVCEEETTHGGVTEERDICRKIDPGGTPELHRDGQV